MRNRIVGKRADERDGRLLKECIKNLSREDLELYAAINAHALSELMADSGSGALAFDVKAIPSYTDAEMERAQAVSMEIQDRIRELRSRDIGNN